MGEFSIRRLIAGFFSAGNGFFLLYRAVVQSAGARTVRRTVSGDLVRNLTAFFRRTSITSCPLNGAFFMI